MTNNVASLWVAVADHAAIVKIQGRANFTTSVSFKRLVQALSRRGLDRVVLDLSECTTMDSTFLGVLAGTALNLGPTSRDSASASRTAAGLQLLNANQRVADLLENLGIADLFKDVSGEIPANSRQYEPTAPESAPSKEELTRTCLEAHKLLMDLNPENVPKFREVAQFLADDLKACTAEAESTPVEPVSADNVPVESKQG